MYSWETPIEDELLKWAVYMRRSNESYIRTTIWGRKQKREAQIYANVFGMVEKRIQREIAIRKPNDPVGNLEGRDGDSK